MDIKKSFDNTCLDKNNQDRLFNSIMEQAKKMPGKRTKMSQQFFVRKAALVAAVVVAVVLLSAGGIYAAARLLSAKDVAKEAGENKLAQALGVDEKNVQSQTAGGYIFTLLGETSGTNLNSYLTDEDIDVSKAYVVIAVEKEDRTAIDTMVDKFYISPYIGDFNPAEYNAYTMAGEAHGMLHDGIMYYITQFDDFEIFADHQLYMGITDNSAGILTSYVLNPDGTISIEENDNKLSLLFELNIDKSKADSEAVEKYLEQMSANDEYNKIDYEEYGQGDPDIANSYQENNIYRYDDVGV